MNDKRKAIAAALAGALLGTAGTYLALPLLRRIDPLGLSPVILISLAGGFVLGWYVRGKMSADRRSDVTR